MAAIAIRVLCLALTAFAVLSRDIHQADANGITTPVALILTLSIQEASEWVRFCHGYLAGGTSSGKLDIASSRWQTVYRCWEYQSGRLPSASDFRFTS